MKTLRTAMLGAGLGLATVSSPGIWAAPAVPPTLVFQATTVTVGDQQVTLDSNKPLQMSPVIRSRDGKLSARVDMVSAGTQSNPIRYGDIELYSSSAPFPNLSQPSGTQPFTLANAYRFKAYGVTHPAVFPAPILRLRQGDTLDLNLSNQLAVNIGQASDSLFKTNFHAHGFHVNPLAMGDNVFPFIDNPSPSAQPGHMQVKIPIPANQESGINWLHVHHHTQTHPQVYGGLAGLIVVGDPLDPWPRYKPDGAQPLKQIFLGLSQVNIQKTTESGQAYGAQELSRVLPYATNTAGTGNTDPTKNWQKRVNGQLNPVITFRPGETQVWNLASMGALGSFSLAVTDINLQRPWQASLLTVDGNARDVKPLPLTLSADPVRNNDLDANTLLMPGNRLTLALTAPVEPGTYYLVDGWGGNNAPSANTYYVLATLQVEGPPVQRKPPVFGARGEDYSLFDTPADKSRRFEFSVVADPTLPGSAQAFVINGKPFGEADMPQLQIGTVEEWTLVNKKTSAGSANHPFHIHQGNFVVTAVNGVPVDPRAVSPQNSLNYVSPRDVINIPTNGSVTIKFKVLDFPGKYVFHCHILKHEDQGMMSPVLAFGPADGMRMAFGGGEKGTAPVLDGFGRLVGTPAPFGPGFKGGLTSGSALGPAKYYTTYAFGTSKRGARVAVYAGRTNRIVSRFNAFPGNSGPNGGVSVALGDINNDGLPEVIVGDRRSGISRLRIFTAEGQPIRNYAGFMAGELPRGIHVASGDVDGDNFDDVIIGAGAGHDPEVMALSGRDIANRVPNPQCLFRWTAGGGAGAGARVAVGYVVSGTRPSYLANIITTPEAGSATGTAEVWTPPAEPMGHHAMPMAGTNCPSADLAPLARYQPFPGDTASLQLSTGYLGRPGLPQVFAWSEPSRIAATVFDAANRPSTQVLSPLP